MSFFISDLTNNVVKYFQKPERLEQLICENTYNLLIHPTNSFKDDIVEMQLLSYNLIILNNFVYLNKECTVFWKDLFSEIINTGPDKNSVEIAVDKRTIRNKIAPFLASIVKTIYLSTGFINVPKKYLDTVFEEFNIVDDHNTNL